LAVSVNYGFDTLYDALNQKLTFTENFLATIAEFNVAVDSTGKPTQSTQFKLTTNQNTVQGLLVLSCVGANNQNDLPLSGIFVSFTKNENSIKINNIKGLNPGTLYTLKVLALS